MESGVGYYSDNKVLNCRRNRNHQEHISPHDRNKIPYYYVAQDRMDSITGEKRKYNIWDKKEIVYSYEDLLRDMEEEDKKSKSSRHSSRHSNKQESVKDLDEQCDIESDNGD